MSSLNHIEATALFITNLYDRALAGIPVLDGRDGDRDIDKECGHPEVITISDYLRMYRRGDVAKRVVNFEPDECWKDYPTIYETEEERETPFEKAVDKLIIQTKLFSYLHRLDRISGIGKYAVLFLGLDDGGEFDTPAPGYNEAGPAKTAGSAKVLYYRIFGEQSATIQEFESDKTNPRYGQPKYYSLAFEDISALNVSTISLGKVHWSRVIHVADNLIESELLGAPRMEDVYNRLLDLRKVSGGSAEMFWKGGFPGLSFEVDPKHGEFDADAREELRADVKAYAEGLQRYITMVGVTVKSLAPQISDPTNCTVNLLTLIAITKGIPKQTFMGSQQGQLDSPQDTITWRERVMLRKERHVTPNIIRVTIDRLIQFGALPTPVAQIDQPLTYVVRWEPMAALSEAERAQVAKDLTEALARYATAGAEALVPLGEWLGKFCGFTAQQVKAVENAQSSRKSLVFEQLDGMTGSAGGNVPSSTPKVPKGSQKKDPSKTPVNKVQVANEAAAIDELVINSDPPWDSSNKLLEAIQALAARPSEPTQVTIHQEPTQVTIHQEPAKVILEQAKPADVVVNVPQQAPPSVNVRVPKQKPPQVNVNPVINVDVPKADPTNVVVNVPQQPAPNVEVTVNPELKIDRAPPIGAKVVRDSEGKITGIEPTK